MSPQGGQSVRPRRRWYQFSLGSLLLVMTIFGVWLGVRMDRARRQQRAVEVLRERGEVRYERRFDHPRMVSQPGKKPSSPQWLRALLGNDFFDRVYVVRLPLSATDADLAYLRDLPDIESLFISGQDVTDEGLRNLCALHQLQLLVLITPNVTDAGLTHLRSLRKLRFLCLDVPLTDNAVESLSSLKALEELDATTICDGIRRATRISLALQENTQLDFANEPLAAVAQFLGDLHGVNVCLDEEAIRIAPDAYPVTASLSKTTLESALNATLNGTGLTWIETPEAIVLTTEQAAAAKLAPVRELRRRLPGLKRVECVVAP